ncbi:MAG: hypothetical protein QM679_07120 [Patulibacter sp.]
MRPSFATESTGTPLNRGTLVVLPQRRASTRRSPRDTLTFDVYAAVDGLRASEPDTDQHGAAGGAGLCCRSRTELHLRLRASPPQQLVLTINPAQLRRHGCETLIERTQALAPHAQITLRVDHATPDLVARGSAYGVPITTYDAAPVARDPHASMRWTPADCAAWMHDTYGLTEAPHTERVLAMLASLGDRSVYADELVDAGIVAGRNAAVRLLRDTSKALLHEEHRNAGAVARAAEAVLVAFAGSRPLRWRPVDDRSLVVAAAQLARRPSLAHAAGLRPFEAGALLELARWIGEAERRGERSVGAPPRTAIYETRRWAAGRIAAEAGACRRSVDIDADALLTVASRAADAIRLAADEALLVPSARLAAAYSALAMMLGGGTATGALRQLAEAQPLSRDPSEAEIAGAALAIAARTPAHLARPLTAELDDQLVRANALRQWIESARDEPAGTP